MNLNKDILRYAVPHQCSQCIFTNGCCYVCHNTPNPLCHKFVPDNMDKFLNDVILYFRLNFPKSKDKKLKRVYGHQSPYTYDDKVSTLDYYYVNFINDCIKQLNIGKTVYVFSLSHVLEILRFIDGVTAVYQGDGIIGLTCNNNKSKINIKE